MAYRNKMLILTLLLAAFAMRGVQAQQQTTDPDADVTSTRLPQDVQPDAGALSRPDSAAVVVEPEGASKEDQGATEKPALTPKTATGSEPAARAENAVAAPKPAQPAPAAENAAVAGGEASASTPDSNAWKKKWVYLGGAIGGGAFTYKDIYYAGYNYYYEDTNGLFAAGAVADIALLDFFSIEAILGMGLADGDVYPVFPLLAKLGYRFGQVETFFDIGYTIGLGFTVGATFGFHAGPGVVFCEGLFVPSTEISNVSDLFFGILGYKIGIGKKAQGTARKLASTPKTTTGSDPAQPASQPLTPARKSGGAVFGYGVLNLALGLGSFVQGDAGGGIMTLLSYGAAAGLIGWELSLSSKDALAGVPGTIGLGVAGFAVLYGFIRPAVYNKNRSLAKFMDGMRVAAAPVEGGGAAVRLSYTWKF